MKKRRISCQVEFGKCGKIADGVELIHEGSNQLPSYGGYIIK